MSPYLTPSRPFPLDWLKRARDQRSVKTNPATWTKYPTMSSLALPVAINRDELVADCRRIGDFKDDDALRLLFVKTMMWGSGTTNGRGPRYTDQALSQGGTLEVLRRVRHQLDDGDIAAAYYAHREIRGIGPSFHTKWLWVVGTAAGTAPQPLILDLNVWNALAELDWNSETEASTRRWGRRYIAYLQACHAWAEQVTKASGAIYSAQDIEYSLFVRGQSG